MCLKIVPFNARYAPFFRDLNLAWIIDSFYLEPKDEELLGNPKEHIIDKGGYIFFAEYRSQIAGCFALLPKGPKVFELSKMAVEKQFQGLGIGQGLLSHAISFAKEKEYEKIELYSSTKLLPALHLYRKHGFLEAAMERNSEYQRSDIKMVLKLPTDT